jgi:hypothetical protein
MAEPEDAAAESAMAAIPALNTAFVIDFCFRPAS